MINLKRLWALALPIALTAGITAPQKAEAQSTPFIGQLMQFGGTYCPRGWDEADGQLLAITTNTPLFSLIGTTYGGDGRSTFALPDLRGRAAIHVGTGPGLSTRLLGQATGTETEVLNTGQMPSHNHIVNSTFLDGNKNGPGTDFLAVPSDEATGTKYDDLDIYHEGPPNRTMDPAMIANTGGGLPHENMPPVLVTRWCIALEGVFPSRP